MKASSSTARRHASDIKFFLLQAKLAAETAEYGAPTLQSRLLAGRLRDAVGRLRTMAAELEREMSA